jgi:hypothetical protein
MSIKEKKEKEKKHYIVSWTYDGDEQFTHLVLMDEGQANKIENELQERVNGGTLQNYSVEEADNLSHKDLLEIMEEEGLRPEEDQEEVA